MNRKVEQADSQYVSKLKSLIELIDPTDITRTSIVSQAKHFFTLTADLKARVDKLARVIEISSKTRANKAALDSLKQKHTDSLKQLKTEHAERQHMLSKVVELIIELCEGATIDETQTASARFLGSTLLLTQGNVKNYARMHQRLKPAYKAVLALRLVDKILTDSSVRHPYLSKFAHAEQRFANDNIRAEWNTYVAKPIIAAALLQDIGLYHPDAERVLKGELSDQDPFRELSEDDRKRLLQINHQQTIRYLQEAIVLPAAENVQPHSLMTDLLQDSFASKSSIGDVLKIPQIYSSVVLSTKPNYNRMTLPTGYLLLEKLAKQGAINQRLCEYFLSMVGYFPPGFGICFIPLNDKEQEKDHHELAIVCKLNPDHPAEPVCRVVSRNLTFTTNGNEEHIPKGRNLYFKNSKQKLMKVERNRLVEIMSQLRNNFTMDQIDDHIPAIWEPYNFFAERKNQIVWK